MKKTIILVLIILIILVVVLAVVFLKKDNTEENKNENINTATLSNQNTNQSSMPQDGLLLSHNECEGLEKPKLSTSPMDFEDFSMITPYGLMIGNHVTPIDHQYFEPTDRSLGADSYPVYAMADALLVDIQSRSSGAPGADLEYRLVFSVSCQLFYYYDLLTSLAPEIQEVFNKESQGLSIPVEEGQIIGYIGGQTLDFAVWDMDVQLNFIVPEHYKSEVWKIHTADPLNYYTDELKTKLKDKYIRTAEPISGKIDHDIDGKLIGTWFIKDTNGYAGDAEKYGGYWYSHLSISPDHIDPTAIVISIGNWPEGPIQFSLEKDAPNPANVGVDDGLLKYNLVDIEYKTSQGNSWDRVTLEKNITLSPTNYSHGCALVQMTSGRELKFEAFPDQNCYSITNFTEQAILYER